MISSRIMYCRPGNLYKEFLIEENGGKVMSTGRPVVGFSGDGCHTLRGCLAQASDKDKSNHSVTDHIITHTIVQSGAPRANRSDRLILGERVFYIVDIDNAGTLGIATLYYAEERTDIK